MEVHVKQTWIGCLLFLLSFNQLTGAAEAPATVTIPIKDYLDLKKQSDKGSVTTIEETKIWGQWGKRLDISFSGAATGHFEPLPVLQESAGLSLSGCNGQALLKASDGSVQVQPMNARFKISCELAIKNWEDFSLTVLNSLFLRTDVRGADVLVSTDSISQRRVGFHRAEVRRETASAPLNDEPSFQARYQISALPEESKFQYMIFANNPNRTARAFELKLPNGEVVGQVDTTNPYETTKNGLSFKLAPGTSRIRITGRLPKPEFHPPLSGKALEYLLLDNHPLLTLDVTGGTRRVSPKDTGMTPSFMGARAYLLGKNDSFSWQVKTLDVFSSLTYTVTSASYRYYASTQSAALVEANFQIDNQGSPEIPLKIPGQATYLEINGVPQVLTKDKDSQLLLRLPSGTGQQVLVQYKTDASPGRTLASVSEELARPASPMSNVSLALQVPGKRSHLFASGLDDVHSMLRWGDIVRGLIVFLLLTWLMRDMSWGNGWTWFAGGAGLVIVFQPSWFFWSVVAFGALVLMRHRQRAWALRPQTWRAWAGLALLGCFVLAVPILFTPAYQRSNARMDELREADKDAGNASGGYGGGLQQFKKMKEMKGAARAGSVAAAPPPQAQAMNMAEDLPEPEAQADEAPVPAADGIATQSYQGLPAKIAIPSDGYTLYFQSGMLDGEHSIHLRYFTVATWLPRFLLFLFALSFGWIAWQRRQTLRAYLRLG
jgi:hypothetical protein